MSTAYKDYYKVLGIESSASADEIKKAFRKLARKHHPDVNPGDQRAEERFKDLTEAYEVLSDPEKRSRYDSLGRDWQSKGTASRPSAADSGGVTSTGADTASFSDFFWQIFGDQSRAQAARPGSPSLRGEDAEAELELTLEEAHRGGRRIITINDEDGQQTVEVKLPIGLRDGSAIRLEGQGSGGFNGGPPGDLYLRIRLSPHKHFAVQDNNDLVVEVPIAPWEAVLGTRVEVPTLDGNTSLKLPAGVQSGQKLRLKGKGLGGRSGATGDLYARVKIVVPKDPSPRERELFEQLARESRFNPRD